MKQKAAGRPVRRTTPKERSVAEAIVYDSRSEATRAANFQINLFTFQVSRIPQLMTTA